MNKSNKGFSLIEILFVIVVFGIVAYAITGMMFSRVRVAERLEVSKGASDTLENALNKLTAIPFKDLVIEGSLKVIDETTIQLLPCTAQTCDYTIEPVPTGGSSAGSSPAGGLVWNGSLPEAPLGSRVFLRRWLVEDVDTQLKLRRITVAVLDSEQSDRPLVMIDTIVGDH